MSLLHTIVAFLVALGLLVIVHELGHYWVARWCGVKVLRFSVGMGKIVYSRRIGPDQTEWAVSLLPLGGYVKMLDAREQDVSGLPPEEQKREFTRQNVWKRIAIVAAGPLANFLMAIAVFAILFMHGIPEPSARVRQPAEQTVAYKMGLKGGDLITAVDGEPVSIWSDLRWKILQLAIEKQPAQLKVQRSPDGQDSTVEESVTLPLDSLTTEDLEGDFLGKLGIGLGRPRATFAKVLPGGPAAAAGFRDGDVIREANGMPVPDSPALIEIIKASPGKPVLLKGRHAGETGDFEIAVTPDSVENKGKVQGRIQVEMTFAEMATAKSGPVEAFGKAVWKTWDTSVLSLKMFGKMLIGEVSWRNITGPITIADYAGQTAKIGLVSYLSFIAFISISLGVMNLLPIPVLDGGLLLYYSVEVFTGRPVSERFAEYAQRAGLGILMTLMAVAFFNDIVRLAS